MSAVHSLHIDNRMPWMNTDDKTFLARVIHGFGKQLPFRLTEKFPLTSKVCAAIKPQLDIKHNRDDALIWWLILLLVFGVLRKSAATVESQKPQHLNNRKMILNRDIYPDSITENDKH